MHFHDTDVKGAWVISPAPHTDERGRFMRSWCSLELAEHGVKFLPVQSNMSFSLQKGTIRGLHYQVAPALEAKLVRCTRGSVFDVVVDLRPTSPTHRRWYGTCLSADNARMMYIPEGCAHGCLSLEDNTEVYYLTSAFYAPECAQGVRFDDPAIGIHWPISVAVASAQDRNWPLLAGTEIEED